MLLSTHRLLHGGVAVKLGEGGVPIRTYMSGGKCNFAFGKKGAFNCRFKSDNTYGACVLCAIGTGGWGAGE